MKRQCLSCGGPSVVGLANTDGEFPLDGQREHIVTKFVLDFFADKRCGAMLDSITRAEVCSVVLDVLLQHGRFPLQADMVEGDPPIYVGEQIRRIDDGSYIVANLQFYDYDSTAGSSTRVFDHARDAVKYFVRDQVKNFMFGVPVL